MPAHCAVAGGFGYDLGNPLTTPTELGQLHMNLHRLLQQRISDGGPPVRVGLIGAGKFGSMLLSQVPTIRGLEVSVIAGRTS